MANKQNGLKRAVADAVGGLRNATIRARNVVVDMLPGERPAWLVVELSGSYPARRRKRKLISLDRVTGAPQEQSLEEFSAQVDALLRAPWLEGVVLRFGELRVGLATAYALRSEISRLRDGGKRVVVFATDLNTLTYYPASAADEIIAPESANLWVHGLAFSTTFMADALARFGVQFQKLAIEEFKNAGDQLALSAMSEAQRLQYDRLLDSITSSYSAAVAEGRDTGPAQVRAWIDGAVSSAIGARELGMIDRVAYEDEFMDERYKPFAAAAQYLPGRTRPTGAKRVAVVSLEGTIVPGKSRNSPLPLPLIGGTLAGSETLVRALRKAAGDPSTAAVVFHVDSGGGSALASDLIWREVKLIAARKPVVAVMGEVAASGGYYVLTHATRVLAAPTTITGSIGVLMAKFVLEGFNARYGLNPEVLERGRFATVTGSDRPWDENEREMLMRYNREIYERFTSRVAEGRGLTVERVDEIGRGRVWSGADALDLGLIDQFGTVETAIDLARELAGLDCEAPVWNVSAPQKMMLPSSSDPASWLGALEPLFRERSLLLHDPRPS